MSASPFTSAGYSYPKDLESYLPEDLGQAFYTLPGAAPAPVGGVRLFDGAALGPRLGAAPVYYRGQVVPVYVYTGPDAAALAAHYERLQLRPAEIGVFAWCQPGQVTLQLKLGASLQPLARLPTATATRRARVVVPLATARAQAWSAGWLLGLFGLAGEPLFDPARVGPAAAAPTFPLLVTRRRAPAAPTPPPRPHKPRQLDVVVGLFFDGTGNNRYATELIYNQFLDKNQNLDEPRLAEILKQLDGSGDNKNDKFVVRHPVPGRPTVPLRKFMVDVDDDGSALNAYSNVVLLHDLYQARAYDPRRASQRQQVVLKHYVQGIGTRVDLDEQGIPVTYYPDDILGSASGRGLRGVIARVEEGLRHVARQLQQLLQASGQELGTLTIDVFGFSRGATAARHCLNELLQPAEEGLLVDTPAYGRLGRACQALEVRLPATLNLRFAGLFDTVVSDVFPDVVKRTAVQTLAYYKGEWDSLNYEKFNGYEDIYTSLADYQGKAIHLVAGDEYRENFPLTPSDAPNRCDIVLYGAHSDVGGGYAATLYNTLVAYFDSTSAQPEKLPAMLADLSRPYRERFTRSPRQGRWVADALGQRADPQRRVYATVGQSSTAARSDITYRRHFIFDAAHLTPQLSLVALHAMLQYGLAEQLPFQPDYRKVRVPRPAAYVLPADAAFQAYLAGVLKLVLDPRTEQVNFPAAVYYPLAEGYIHESSGYNKSAYFKTPGNNSNLLDFYVNKPNAVTKPATGAAARPGAAPPPALDPRRQLVEPLARVKSRTILQILKGAVQAGQPAPRPTP